MVIFCVYGSAKYSFPSGPGVTASARLESKHSVSATWSGADKARTRSVLQPQRSPGLP